MEEASPPLGCEDQLQHRNGGIEKTIVRTVQELVLNLSWSIVLVVTLLKT